MKIKYVNCGVKNYMKDDHRSYRRNFFFTLTRRLTLELGSNNEAFYDPKIFRYFAP